MNVSSVSNKSPLDIANQIVSVLGQFGAKWQYETQFRILCEVDVRAFGKKQHIEAFNINDPEIQMGEVSAGQQGSSSSTVVFQVEICKVPTKDKAYGLYFKRLHGGVWNYKKICNTLLSTMKL